MKCCRKCGNKIPNRIVVDGVIRNISARKYCVTCSPFGLHNTKQLDQSINEDEHTKTCARCNKLLDKKFFYLSGGTKKRYSSYCKNCITEVSVNKRRVLKQKYVDLKGGKCSICGYNKSIKALDFHHLDPNIKEFEVSRLRGVTNKLIHQELEKCVLVCANCHREIHGSEY